MAAVIAVAVPLGVAAKVESTHAAWTASAAANSNVAALKLNAPSNLRCEESGTGNQAIIVRWDEGNNSQVAMDGYRITVGVGGESSEEDVAVTSKSMALNEGTGGLLGGVIDLLGGLLALLFGGAKDVDVSVAAVHSSGWVSAPVTIKGLAIISKPALSPVAIKCK